MTSIFLVWPEQTLIGRLFLSLIVFMSGLVPGGLFATSPTLIFVRIKLFVIHVTNLVARLFGLATLWYIALLSLVRIPTVAGLGHDYAA